MILNIPVAIRGVKKKVFKKPHNKWKIIYIISSTNPNIILIDSEHKIPKKYRHFLKYPKTTISDTQLIFTVLSRLDYSQPSFCAGGGYSPGQCKATWPNFSDSNFLDNSWFSLTSQFSSIFVSSLTCVCLSSPSDDCLGHPKDPFHIVSDLALPPLKT